MFKEPGDRLQPKDLSRGPTRFYLSKIYPVLFQQKTFLTSYISCDLKVTDVPSVQNTTVYTRASGSALIFPFDLPGSPLFRERTRMMLVCLGLSLLLPFPFATSRQSLLLETWTYNLSRKDVILSIFDVVRIGKLILQHCPSSLGVGQFVCARTCPYLCLWVQVIRLLDCVIGNGG